MTDYSKKKKYFFLKKKQIHFSDILFTFQLLPRLLIAFVMYLLPYVHARESRNGIFKLFIYIYKYPPNWTQNDQHKQHIRQKQSKLKLINSFGSSGSLVYFLNSDWNAEDGTQKLVLLQNITITIATFLSSHKNLLRFTNGRKHRNRSRHHFKMGTYFPFGPNRPSIQQHTPRSQTVP